VTAPSFSSLRVRVAEGIAWVTIDHPPLNLLDAALLDDLDRLSLALVDDEQARVVVFDSADTEFFIAHADVRGTIGRGDAHAEPRERLSRFAGMTSATGPCPRSPLDSSRAARRGGGSEFALALDMRFAARGRAVLGQPEVALGFPLRIRGGHGSPVRAVAMLDD
jgi:enoyl-CoA hydratase/carnithine racemase